MYGQCQGNRHEESSEGNGSGRCPTPGHIVCDFEAEDRLGGHAYTMNVDGVDGPLGEASNSVGYNHYELFETEAEPELHELEIMWKERLLDCWKTNLRSWLQSYGL